MITSPTLTANRPDTGYRPDPPGTDSQAADQRRYGQAGTIRNLTPARVLVPAPRKPGETPLLRQQISHPSPPGSADWRSECSYPLSSDMPSKMRGWLMVRGYTETVYNANSWMIRGLDPDVIAPLDRIGLFTVLEIRDDNGHRTIVLECDCGNVAVKELAYFASRLPLMCRSACLAKIARESQVE